MKICSGVFVCMIDKRRVVTFFGLFVRTGNLVNEGKDVK